MKLDTIFALNPTKIIISSPLPDPKTILPVVAISLKSFYGILFSILSSVFFCLTAVIVKHLQVSDSRYFISVSLLVVLFIPFFRLSLACTFG